MTSGVTASYYTLLEQIQVEREKFAFLQLVGRLEDVLVKEFVYHIFCVSKGRRFGLTNVGSKDEQKIDVAVLAGAMDDKESCVIRALVEAKYLRNWHRAWESNARDETKPTLESLARQLGQFKKKKHGGFSVKLSSRTKEIYGLVFASFVSTKRNSEGKEDFFHDILHDYAGSFRYHDLPRPYFRPVYEDVIVRALGCERFCTLKAGLWKLD